MEFNDNEKVRDTIYPKRGIGTVSYTETKDGEYLVHVQYFYDDKTPFWVCYRPKTMDVGMIVKVPTLF